MAPIEREHGKELLFTPATQLDAVSHFVKAPFGFEGSSLHMYRQDTALMQPSDPTPQADAVMAVMHLRSFGQHREWHNGQMASVTAAPAGTFRLYDLRDTHIADIPFAFHTVHLLLPNSAFGRVSQRLNHGSPRWDWPVNGVIENQVLHHLIEALLPALEIPNYDDMLFCEYLFVAIAHHISRTYGYIPPGGKVLARGLARWQESLAKELLINRIAGNIHLDEVASSCGLTADNFSRMFGRTTGMPPYRWLNLQRIERAKHLLKSSHESLAEIALACGFANQSHFTRTFSRVVGSSPGEWRRQIRL
jgi:AraC family transcriptional regulator